MKNNDSVIELIKERVSCRTFDGEELNTDTMDKVDAYLLELNDKNYRFEVVTINGERSEKLGTYGVIKGANKFVVGIAKRLEAETSPENFGYIFEKFILYATYLGLGSCWLGGTFTRSGFAKSTGLKDDEIIPCITPIGYPKHKKSITEILMRKLAGSNSRKPFDELFFQEDLNTPLDVINDSYRIPLEMVRTAPSASNKQPWRIIKTGNGYGFYLERSKGYNKALSFDVQRSDIGIAMCHFELACRELGLSGDFQREDYMHTEGLEYIISWVK